MSKSAYAAFVSTVRVMVAVTDRAAENAHESDFSMWEDERCAG